MLWHLWWTVDIHIQEQYMCSNMIEHYNHLTWPWRLKSPATRLFVQWLVNANITKVTKLRITDPSWGGSIVTHVRQCVKLVQKSLQWRHNWCDGVSIHLPHHCLLKRLLKRRSKKTSKLCVTGLCGGNSPVTGEFPAQMVSNAENVFIWWRHYVLHKDVYFSVFLRWSFQNATL